MQKYLGVAYDAAYMSKEGLKALASRLAAAKRAVLKQAATGEQGWLNLPDDAAMARRIAGMVKEKGRYKTCLVLGIGGSDLGARALSKAILSREPDQRARLVFAGANTDPDELHAIMSSLDWRDTLVNVISKSGDTIETMASFMLARERLKKAVGARVGEQIVATTSADRGALLDLAQREGYGLLPVPSNVGGRFSVLSNVGLFPLAFAGAPIAKILKGAAEERDRFVSQAPGKNPAMQFAALSFLAAVGGRATHVLMPYAESLREFGYWYRQLWAESLGKGGTGITPIAALGATDQHSQIQLYMDGPEDKVVTFMEVDNFAHDMRLPVDMRKLGNLAVLAGKKLGQVLHAEREATAWALSQAGRPNGTLRIPDVSPQSLGSLIMFFEITVAVLGELYKINAYDQPAVELGKKAMYDLLMRTK